MADLAPVTSSPAAEPGPSIASVIQGLDPAAKAEWQLTGKVPEPSTEPAASSPAEPAAPDVSTDTRAQAASEPATPQPKKGKANLDTRVTELRATNAELQAELDRRRQLKADLAALHGPSSSASDVKPAASSPAAPTSMAEFIQSPDLSKPPLSDLEFFALFPDAGVTDAARYAARYEHLQARAQDAVVSRGQSVVSAFMQKLGKDEAERQAFWAEQSPEMHALDTGHSQVAREILTSDDPKGLISYFSEHPEDVARLDQLPHTEMVRHLGRIEARLSAAVPTPPTAPRRGVSSAPEPATSLGRRPAVPADDALAAVSDGDFRRYRDAENRKALQARRA